MRTERVHRIKVTNFSNANPEASTTSLGETGNELESERTGAMDFESLYDHCATEKTLLFQLNKMSELLRASTERQHGGTQIDTSKFDDNSKLYPIENNLFLRAIASSIDNMHGLLKSNTDSVNALASRVSYVESSNERSISDLSERLIETENACIQNKGGINEVYRYVDESVSTLKDAIPETVAEVSREVDSRLEAHEAEIKKAQLAISLLPTHESIAEKFEKVLSSKIAKLEETSFSRLSNIENRVDKLESKVPVTKEDLNEVMLRISKLETDMRTELERIKSGRNSPKFSNVGEIDELFQDARKVNGNSRPDWSKQNAKLDAIESRIEGLEHELTSYKKTTDSLSIQIRKENVIIDQLQEVENENLLARRNTILDVTLTPPDRKEVQIKRVFRLGVKRTEGPPRKILLELKSGREILFEKARLITK